jgi:hypothetical protein
MSIRLEVDNTNVEQFPALNLQDIAACARRFADEVDKGAFGDISMAMLVVETADGLETLHWGESISIREAIGIFDIAKAHFIAKVLGDGE